VRTNISCNLGRCRNLRIESFDHLVREQRDELAPLQLMVSRSQGRIAGYRIGRDQSGGNWSEVIGRPNVRIGSGRRFGAIMRNLRSTPVTRPSGGRADGLLCAITGH
jgi:hypothetical protein